MKRIDGVRFPSAARKRRSPLTTICQGGNALRRPTEEALPQALGSLPQFILQIRRLDGRYRHPLPINWVETAKGIAKDYEALREAGQAFITATLVGFDTIGKKIGKRLDVFDHLTNLRRGQAFGASHKSFFWVGAA